MRAPLHRPHWIRAKLPDPKEYLGTKAIVRQFGLHTVCEEARCPNIGECWSCRTATFLIMGDVCTRACNFCAVKKQDKHRGKQGGGLPLDLEEPRRVALAAAKLGLKYAVITSVTRDDLPDGGAGHFSRTVLELKKTIPGCKIELLIPDLSGVRSSLETIVRSGIDVLNHNLETVFRLYGQVRPQADYQRSLMLLKWAKEIEPTLTTKSGLMVGLGEKKEEVLELMDDLRAAGVDILTIGQYLRPSTSQIAVERYVCPEELEEYRKIGLARKFRVVESAPLVRSSYHAWRHG